MVNLPGEAIFELFEQNFDWPSAFVDGERLSGRQLSQIGHQCFGFLGLELGLFLLKTIYDGMVPLMKDAKVVKEVSLRPMKQIDVEVSAGTEAVIIFYKQTMSNMGWQIGLKQVLGSNGMMQLRKDRSILMLNVMEKNEKNTVNTVTMNQ